MANTVNQPSVNPTNKLTAATIAGAGMSLLGLVLRNIAPEWYDQDVLLALLPLVIFATGWVFKDNPNIVVVVEDNQ
jgi:hypothetical protein